MRRGATGVVRDAATQHYVRAVDELAEHLAVLESAGVLAELEQAAAAIYGGRP